MINKTDWEERKIISDFLYKKGWQITKSELLNVLDEYGFREEYENLTKHNSSSKKDCSYCENGTIGQDDCYYCSKCGREL